MIEPPHLVLACVVERDGRFLLVEEAVGGARVLNQPAGHWEPGERFIDGAIRETREETGWDVRVDALIGIYEHRPATLPYAFVRLCFAATALRHHPDQPLDEGILGTCWLTADELAACAERHRSPMVWRAVMDYQKGQRLPLSVLAHLP